MCLIKEFELFDQLIFLSKNIILSYTGTGAEIEAKKKADEFCDGKTCDCCGAKLSPFSFNTLCDDCEERMRCDLFYKQFSTSIETPWFLTE